MKIHGICAVFLLLLSLAPFSFGGEHPYKINSDLDHAIKAGLHELYDMNFEQSLAIFDSLKSEEVDHPMVAFGVAATHWWRISSYVLESDPVESKAFLDAVDHCIEVSEEHLKKGDPTGEAHHVLGGTYGLLGRWQATNHEWLSAYSSGKRAYKYLTQALKTNPKLVDAYMGLGIFDYFVATLPSIVRVLAFAGMGGNPQIGLDELHKAATEGTYARTSSQLFLMQIYSEEIGDFKKAHDIVDELRKEYPRSSFMHMMDVIVDYNAGKIGELADEASDFEKKIADKTYSDEFRPEALFSMALTKFKLQKWPEAAAYFEKAKNINNDKNPWCTWAALYLGYCDDAMKKRSEAKKEYHWVLDHLRRWGSHDNANAHLNRPFTGKDTELKKLEL